MYRLLEALKKFTINPHNKIIQEDIIHLENNGNPVVTIYTSNKRAEFHDEYSQIALDIPELRPVVDALFKEGYSMNLD